jgi:hypothetical protein
MPRSRSSVPCGDSILHVVADGALRTLYIVADAAVRQADALDRFCESAKGSLRSAAMAVTTLNVEPGG